MLVIGAKGHAKEVLEILIENNFGDQICFFDNINRDIPDKLFNTFDIIKSFEKVQQKLKKDESFVTGIGNSKSREFIVSKFEELGGVYKTIISQHAQIGSFDVNIQEGCNIMSNVFISNSVSIGRGCLINQGASIHHDVKIGHFCDLSPNATVLGRVQIGNNVIIGSGAVVLPDLIIEDNAIIGAGAVVTRSVKEGALIVGVPGKIKKNLNE